MLITTDENIILKGTIGSHSYGTATPTSDYDYMEVVIPPEDVYLGMESWGSAGTKETSYDDPVKGFVECKAFELKKFLGMPQTGTATAPVDVHRRKRPAMEASLVRALPTT
jgi:predicted nucleotidyltransferase